jgi:hypothetical protein
MDDELDLDKLLGALDDEDNEPLMGTDMASVVRDRDAMLERLGLPEDELAAMRAKLDNYRYVDEVHELRFGAYVRWVPLRDPTKLRLTNGGIVCDMQVHDDGIHIVCRNNMHRMYQIRASECLVFQKMSDQERVLLEVMGHLNDV